jgi:hypothetical protein
MATLPLTTTQLLLIMGPGMTHIQTQKLKQRNLQNSPPLEQVQPDFIYTNFNVFKENSSHM